jgi:8-oxo-dGTP pyrophosphatase MutT (NUDIX family)
MADLLAAGIILYNQNTKRYLIIQHSYYSGGHWGFPKGAVEPNETVKEAAIREVKEEVGITVDKLEEFEKVNVYEPHYFNGKLKEVHYFLSYTTQEGLMDKWELQDMRWLLYNQAIERLQYDRDKEILKKAEEFILQQIHQ